MDKQKLIKDLIQQLESDLQALKVAALANYEAATHEENKPENEYDTRGLEASYIAGAQAKRAGEIEELIFTFRDIQIRHFTKTDPIQSTALVEVSHQGKKSFVFVLPKGGGVILKVGSTPVQTVTPTSPLGEALMGLKVGDLALVETGAKTREYETLSLQ